MTLDNGTERTLSKFADDSKLGTLADTLDGCSAIQKDLGGLKKWADKDLMKFNREYHRIIEWFGLEGTSKII